MSWMDCTHKNAEDAAEIEPLAREFMRLAPAKRLAAFDAAAEVYAGIDDADREILTPLRHAMNLETGEWVRRVGTVGLTRFGTACAAVTMASRGRYAQAYQPAVNGGRPNPRPQVWPDNPAGARQWREKFRERMKADGLWSELAEAVYQAGADGRIEQSYNRETR